MRNLLISSDMPAKYLTGSLSTHVQLYRMGACLQCPKCIGSNHSCFQSFLQLCTEVMRQWRLMPLCIDACMYDIFTECVSNLLLQVYSSSIGPVFFFKSTLLPSHQYQSQICTCFFASLTAQTAVKEVKKQYQQLPEGTDLLITS